MQNDSIIVTDLKNITLSSQFLTLSTPNGDTEIDIKKLLKEPINSDSAYFNATQLAKMYNTDPAQLLRVKGWKKYIEAMEKVLRVKYADNAHLKKIELVKTKRGKADGGTWVHSKAIIEFIRKLDVDFAVAMDLFIQDLIIHSNELKIERDNTKILFKDLTKSIKNHYIPAQTSDNAKKFAYSNLSGLINIKVLGSTATKYAKDNNIEVEQGKSVRDYLSKEQLEQIEEHERVMSGLIEFAGVVEYEELKELLK